MSDGSPVRARQNCCRLCLAPGSECISILNSYAADKEPLATKIQNCVSIKIKPEDHLSLRICHACISYLNSWQSFKNRCLASQSKQRSWLDTNKRQQLLDNNVSISTIGADGTGQHQHQAEESEHQTTPSLASSILDGISSLKKRKSLTVYPLPAVEIKDEPMDPDDEYNTKQHDESDDMVDPTLFLERTEAEGDEALMEHMPYHYEPPRPPIELAALVDTKEASCRACNLKFSTRANARRHERNLHPNLFELSTSTPNNMPVTKPTPALAAALELQRASAVAAAAAEASKAASGMITPLKYRQEIVNAFNKCEIGGFDYEHPEKYQHHLTDEKIVFLQQNDEFLRQYQNMTCRCCNKTYSTYKNFMAHMRKKYLTLPRNLCFNCLKLNDSKALFISHLKRRNCINLYKVLHALMTKDSNFAAAVTATAAAVPDKLRAKELLVNKMYECKLCPKKYRLKLEFRSHVYDEHADMQRKDTMQKQCCYCGLELDDPAERKRHYNNMDCIVSLRCVTCDAKFDNHQKFLDHVYEKHLAGFGEQTATSSQNISAISTENSPGKKSTVGLGGASSTDESRSSHHAASANQPKSQYFSRMPQACPICDQQYNNYNNVLRHMESKHPDQLPQTYKCVKCGIGYPRLSNLREHMVSAHCADKARHTGFEYIVNADAVKIAYGTQQNVYTGRYDYVMKDLMSITNGGSIADDDENSSENPVKKMRTDTGASVTTNTGSGGSGGNMYSSLKECPICNAVFSNNIGLSNHMRSHSAAAQNNSLSAGVLNPNKSAPSGLTITPAPPTKPTTPPAMQHQTAVQKAIFKRNLEQAADRRFRRMRCRLCQRRFSSKKSYRFHMLNDHQIRNVQFIKCKLCDAEFAYEKGLKVHMFKIHNTLLKDEMIEKQFECDICSIVYRSEPQLQHHKKTVHGSAVGGVEQADNTFDDNLAGGGGGAGGAGADASSAANPADRSGLSTPVSSAGAERSTLDTSTSGPLYWYQCKYCPSNFNTNKKLAIHINSHDEFDSNDYSCKDCGNVYSGRKSLWVHRYKKHPQFPEPSECVLCKKVFFDRQMLENHIPTCNRKPINAAGAVAESAGPPPIYKHKTGDDDDDASHDASGVITTSALGGGELEITPIPASGMKIKLPEVACTICGQRFTDQELFAKHIQMHEMELYTDNPLAAMFDTGPADPNQFYLDRVNDNGEYACDLCNKTFTQMTALKVHRKWHFRGDSKQNQADGDPSASAAANPLSQIQINHQHPLGLQAVGLMPNPHHHSSKSQKRKRELKCEYCPSTFISNNNLRRHIYELHKEEIGNLPVPPKIVTDPYLQCRRCQEKFETKNDWIAHKVSDARVTKPFGPFQWGCDLCGAYVSRKEKLINHIHNHLKEKEIVPVEEQQQAHDQNQNRAVKTNAATATATAGAVAPMSIQVVADGEVKVKQEQDSDEEKEDLHDGVLKREDEEYDEDYIVGEADGEVEEGESVRQSVSAVRRSGMVVTDDDVDEDASEEEADEDEEYDDIGQLIQMDMNAQADGEAAEADEDDGDDAEEGVEDADDDADVDMDNEEDSNGRTITAPNGRTYARVPPAAKQITIESNRISTDTTEDSSPSYDEDDDDSDDDSDAESGDSSSQASKTPAPAPKVRFSCDLCRVFFDSQQELQKHVKMHFLNGPGSVSLTEIKPKTGNKSSRSSSSDVVTV